MDLVAVVTHSNFESTKKYKENPLLLDVSPSQVTSHM